MWIERKYLSLVAFRLRNYQIKQESPLLVNFSCPICGDSTSNPRKARGYIYTIKNSINYKCHNCGISISFQSFLKTVDSQLYKDYRYERYKIFKKEKKEEPKIQKLNVKDILADIAVSVAGLDINHEALKFLSSRHIPKSKYADLFYVKDAAILTKMFPQFDELPNDSRIIIPIRNRLNELIGVNCRAINPKSKLRYMLLKCRDEPMIYGLNKVDLNKQVYVVEGAFDSMFLKNSIAVDGSDFSKISEFLPKENAIIVFDNQPRNLEIVKKIRKVIDEGWKVFIWPPNYDRYGKDINEIILSGISKEELENVISRNIYQGLKAKLKFGSWRIK